MSKSYLGPWMSKRFAAAWWPRKSTLSHTLPLSTRYPPRRFPNNKPWCFARSSLEDEAPSQAT